MPTISNQKPVLTLINTFTVQPERQEQVIELLNRATQDVMRHLPGFISASVHRGIDGNKIANYAQWRSHEDFQAIFGNQKAVEHMQEIMALCEKFEPVLYAVETCYEAASRDLNQTKGAIHEK